MTNRFKDTSPYVNTTISGWYLDQWNPPEVRRSSQDRLIEIPSKYDQRPDLLSQSEYGTPRLWWVFAVRNPDLLVDPIGDFTAGKQIYIPTDILRA